MYFGQTLDVCVRFLFVYLPFCALSSRHIHTILTFINGRICVCVWMCEGAKVCLYPFWTSTQLRTSNAFIKSHIFVWWMSIEFAANYIDAKWNRRKIRPTIIFPLLHSFVRSFGVCLVFDVVHCTFVLSNNNCRRTIRLHQEHNVRIMQFDKRKSITFIYIIQLYYIVESHYLRNALATERRFHTIS